MKKLVKILSIMLCFCAFAFVFSACTDDDSDDGNETLLAIPSEIKVEGYLEEITVGEQFFIEPTIQQKKNGNWVEVPSADYVFECDYDGSSYGEFDFVVYLKEYSHIKFEDKVNVLPKTVTLPSFSTVYTGQSIKVKEEIESKAEELYEVTKYTNMTNVGSYSASLTLTNPDMYVWVNSEGEVLKGNTRSITWTITKAPAKNYTGNTRIDVYYGDTLYEVGVSNDLKNIIWTIDPGTIITNQTSASAYYNESPGNYEDTLITIFFNEIIKTSHYKVEFYLYEGNDYVLYEDRTQNILSNIGEFIDYSAPSIDGYEINQHLSITSGKVLKQDGLVLKLYYDVV